MMLNSLSRVRKSLEQAFKKLFRIVDIGPADFLGDARVRLDDGSSLIVRRPVKGQVGSWIYADVEHCEYKAAFIVTKHDGTEVEVPYSEFRKSPNDHS